MPSNVTVMALSSSTIHIDWSASTDESGIDGYVIYRAGSPYDVSLGLEFMDEGLSPSTTYCYQVTAVDAAGNESAPSEEQCATTMAEGETTFALTVTTSGTGSGTVNGPGISCGSDCIEVIASGTSVTLSATASAGSSFAGWTGCDSVEGASCALTMNADRTITANFVAAPTSYLLTVSRSGTGSGTVSGPGISCGTDCSESYISGTSVMLTAVAASGSSFGGWSGCDTPSGATCTMSMTTHKTVTATFNSVPSNFLTVSRSGTGSGTVTSSPAGISCGTDCSEPYISGTSVMLTAVAASGSSFGGWSGCDTPSGATCTMSMTTHKTVTATFNTSSQTVTFIAIASNMVEYNSLDPTVANTVFQNTYPPVGINSFWNLAGGAAQAFAGVVKYNVSSLSGKTIESATLRVTANSAPVGYYRKNWKIGTIATSWSPTSITWNSMASFYYYTSTWQSFYYPTYSGQIYEVNVLETVQSWANGTYPNYGIGFLSTDYTVPGNVTSFDAYDFVTPTLTVMYH